MNIEQIMQRISRIINETFETSYTIDASTNANDIEEWDSISHISLITNIEKDFRIRLALGELQDLKNVGEMAQLIQTKLT